MSQPPRKFDDLRGGVIRAPAASQEEPIESVIRRLFNTSADGIRVLAWMRAEVRDPLPVSAPECALRDRAGAARFIEKIHSLSQGNHVS